MFKKILPLIKKELAFFFHSPIAYVSLAIFLIVANWLYFSSFYLVGQASMRGFFQNIPLIFILLVPALSMGSLAEEKRLGTDEVLFTLPFTNGEIALGKFLGMLIVLLIGVLLTVSIPVTLFFLGQPEIGPILTGYLAVVFLGSFYLSIGLFISSMTESQVVSFTLSAVICFVFYITGSSMVLQRAGGLIEEVLRSVSALTHFANMSKGILDLRDVIYYLSLTGTFIYLTAKRIQRN